MNGDLSLSQSLGGLRIANPDDGNPASPTSTYANSPTLSPSSRPAPPSSHSSASTVTDRRPHLSPALPQETLSFSQPIDFHPASYSTHSAPFSSPDGLAGIPVQQTPQQYDSSRSPSGPVGYQAQQQMQYPSHTSSFSSQLRQQSSSQSTPVRPVSGLYSHHNTSSSSQGSYRFRDDANYASLPAGIARSSSRSSAAATAKNSGVPSRESSRSYRQSQHGSGGNGPLPPRRSSRRAHMQPGASSPSQAVPYAVEGGPLPSSEEWKEKGAAVSTRQDVDANGRPISRIIKKGVKDFNFGRTLGEGSYSTVLAATDRQTLREYAIKVLDKRHIIKEKKVKYVNIERDTLNRLTDHPGIVRLYYTFQDERSLYFVLDLASGGELLGVLKKTATFDEECTRFYGAQILDSIAYMHSRGVIHRDLKPENVLLDDQMHVKITDFGTAKILGLRPPQRDGVEDTAAAGDPMDGAGSDRAVSFVGTAEYVSPELLTDKNACKASDLWAFGCIVYQLLAGRPPFKAGNEYQTFQKIVALDYSFPDSFPEVAKDLVGRLLVLDPAKRLPIEQIRGHPFFEGIQWGKGLWKQKAPRLKSFVPLAAEPIRMNGSSMHHTAAMAMGSVAKPPLPVIPAPSNSRPQLRAITELPPPSQLDIEWSPVLTRNNERILKLGNLIVFSAPGPHPTTPKNGDTTPEAPKKFSRFFGGGATKKRQRLVMITSSARLVMAAAGGEEKKAKMEVNLLSQGTSWRSFVDARGLTGWCVDTKDKHLTFEDPRATTSDPDGSKYSTAEWLEMIERAKDFALSQSISSYSGDSTFNELGSAISSPSSTLGGDAAGELPNIPSSGHRLRKEHRDGDGDSVKGRKRFSKRHSKSGLAAVF
ncbi:serine/threonine protein kinase [Elasticomyces elasticus]|nr:serine/threonine protein kinase [Elasticomyces elasticus]KAK4999180.1 serine/threonine protein kinase [Elasticomyces elasticus]